MEYKRVHKPQYFPHKKSGEKRNVFTKCKCSHQMVLVLFKTEDMKKEGCRKIYKYFPFVFSIKC